MNLKGRRFANLDPGAAPHTLLTAPRNLEPKKFVRRVKAGEESAPARCPPDQRGHAGEREMPRAQAAASRSPRPPLLRPPWAPRPTACRVFCLLLLGTLLPRADACSCSPVHPQQAFYNTDIVIGPKRSVKRR
ncbi:uncharacterized protein LOC113879894 [Bos indicus x Bos taurus]|uniref:uncharacterized protein LOC113879894 n=1 Tax=Bos indicus x Bos taurus TaxID=30522 RepID=UPI000F7D5A4E|nr:uncharacterized protein LOC113879894 [Bos indicus x Bos taurus]